MEGQEHEILARLHSVNRMWEPSRLKVPIGKRLLVIAPHPDDESIGVGGLLLAHRGKCELNIINVFNGDRGGRLSSQPWMADPDYQSALVSARREELTTVGKLLGAASIQYLDLRDGVTIPNSIDAQRLREMVNRVRPDVVLLPWYLDDQRDHRATNVLYSWACADVDCVVIGFEVWTLCQPNAIFDITAWLDAKLDLVGEYRTQTATVDYAGYVLGVARTRGFLHGVRSDRSGAAEAFFVLPSRDYCDIVRSFYGEPDHLLPAARAFF
jgi:LmbE family N-acetylglucosaminyl deacetylase